jgi:hypothetical protein
VFEELPHRPLHNLDITVVKKLEKAFELVMHLLVPLCFSPGIFREEHQQLWF